MRLVRCLPNKKLVTLFCHNGVEDRLFTRHFQVVQRPMAAHFRRWRSVREMIKTDDQIYRELMHDIAESHQESGDGVYSTTFTHHDPVGWETSAPLAAFRLDELEPFRVNDRATALRVKRSVRDRPAPLTNLVTIAYEVMPDRDAPEQLFVFIQDVHPGVDLGAREGDMTAREKRVFYSQGHWGA